MKKLLVFLGKYRRDSILAPLFKLLEALLDLLVPIVVARIINIGIVDGQRGVIPKYFAFLIVLAAAGMLFSFTAQWFAARASVGFGTDLRQTLFDHIQKLSYSELDKLGTDTLITRMTSDINQVQTVVNLSLRLLLRSPFIVFGSMIMAFTIDVKCAVVFAVAIPVLSVVVFGIMMLSIPLFAKAQSALDRLLGKTRENLTGVRVIRAFTKERESVAEFDAENEALTRMNERVGRLSALMNPLTYVLINIATIFLIKVGAVRVNMGAMQQGDVVALYNYMAQMIIELIKLSSLIVTINKSIACGNRIQDILEIKPGMEYPADSVKEPEGNREAVKFTDVSFAYGGSEDAVTGLNFCADKGQTIGIIGGTGSGKTTVVNLIPRFYDAEKGAVEVNGVNVRNYPEGALIDKIGVVPQKALLFEGTIRDNMKWGNESASDKDIWDALTVAQAREVVEGKDGQLDYMVEQNGRNLSGGQKQRLTIARALLKQPDILILDDSASALDFATDLKLRQAIHGLGGDMTVFIVSQRASSVRAADKIIVLDDGVITGIGTHDELMDSCPVYREIFYSQFPEVSK